MHNQPFANERRQYAHVRPTYPESLFTFLSTTVASREVAWDCATVMAKRDAPARYFGRVIATDESAEMIAQAPREPKIAYRSPRQRIGHRGSLCGLGDGSFCYPLFDLNKSTRSPPRREARRCYCRLDLLYTRL